MNGNNSRFFTMNQLWQSIAVAVVIGGGLVGMAVYGFSDSETPAVQKQAGVGTTTQATTSLPAAAAGAIATEPFEGMHLSAQAAIVVDLSNGQTIYSQNADKELPLASLTKLITIYAAQHALSADSLVTISSTSLAQEGEYGFTLGETFAYKDIARLAMVNSSNDAAEAIAEAASSARGTDVPGLMAQTILDVGLSNTRAMNATGLDLDLYNAGSYGSARDIAKLATQFLSIAPDISAATTHGSATAYSSTGIAHSLPNTNPNATTVAGLLLSKTGYTDLAGGNLAIIFDAGIDHPVAIVVLGSTAQGRFSDVRTLTTETLRSFSFHP